MYWRVEAIHDDDPITQYEGKIIRLLTPEELNRLPDGIMLISICGEEIIKGVNYIDDDTRAGYLAFGTLAEED